MIYGIGGAVRERDYLFIDGGCLRAAVRTLCRDEFGDPDAYQPLISAFTPDYNKVFYYDAVPGRGHNEAQAVYEARVAPDHERFARIQALDRVHIALGQIVGADRRQKGVDVRLAVDMMTHAFRGNTTKATLLAGDADFVPLVRSLVNEGLHITLWHPSQANAELKGAADSCKPLKFGADIFRLTRDGENPAFQAGTSNAGMIKPSDAGLTAIAEIDGMRHAGQWANGKLTIWRSFGDARWAFIELIAPGSSLAQALKAFDLIHSWNVAETGEQWVHV